MGDKDLMHTRWNRRDAKRDKRKHGMRVHGRQGADNMRRRMERERSEALDTRHRRAA